MAVWLSVRLYREDRGWPDETSGTDSEEPTETGWAKESDGTGAAEQTLTGELKSWNETKHRNIRVHLTKQKTPGVTDLEQMESSVQFSSVQYIFIFTGNDILSTLLEF